MNVDGIKEFLASNPLMRLNPINQDGSLVVNGRVRMNHVHQGYPVIGCWVTLRVTIPSGYPKQLPVFEETGGLIPRDGDYHVNPDGTICLGSNFRLHMALSIDSCINRFYQLFFVPYAYAALLKLQHNVNFIFGELSHGVKGELEDFCELFNVANSDSVFACLKALSQKKRIANKHVCPCGCGNRLGACKFNCVINQYRNIVPRSQFCKISQQLFY